MSIQKEVAWIDRGYFGKHEVGSTAVRGLRISSATVPLPLDGYIRAADQASYFQGHVTDS